MSPRSDLSFAHVAAIVLAAALIAGCASKPTLDRVRVNPNTVRIETPTGAVEARTIAEDRADTRTVQLTLPVAWSQIAAVYGELGLNVNAYVDQSKQIGARGQRLRGRVGKLRASQVVSCGADVTGEDKANSYEVMLEVISTLAPAPNDQTTLATMVTASARPMATSGDPVRCVTTGQLERRIALALTVKGAGK